MKTSAMNLLDELNQPSSPEFKAALRAVVESIAKQANKKLKLNPCGFCGEAPITCSHIPNDQKVNVKREKVNDR